LHAEMQASQDEGIATPVVNASLMYYKLCIRVSSETMPTVTRMIKRVSALFQKPADHAKGTSDNEFKAFERERSEDDSRNARARRSSITSEADQKHVVIPGEVHIVGQEFHLSLYGHDMMDPTECCQISLQRLDVQLERNRREHDLYRFVALELINCFVMKIKKGDKALPNPKDFTVENIINRARNFRSPQTIFHVPHAKIDLQTIQTMAQNGTMSPLVHCEFDSQFDQDIDATLDRYLYTFLTDLIGGYKAQKKAEPAPTRRHAIQDLTRVTLDSAHLSLFVQDFASGQQA